MALLCSTLRAGAASTRFSFVFNSRAFPPCSCYFTVTLYVFMVMAGCIVHLVLFCLLACWSVYLALVSCNVFHCFLCQIGGYHRKGYGSRKVSAQHNVWPTCWPRPHRLLICFQELGVFDGSQCFVVYLVFHRRLLGPRQKPCPIFWGLKVVENFHGLFARWLNFGLQFNIASGRSNWSPGCPSKLRCWLLSNPQ